MDASLAESACTDNADDQDLVARAALGDRDAFSALIGQNYERIHRTALRWCGNTHDAEDIAQGVCIRLGQAIRGFRGDSSFATWLYRLTVNAVRDHQRAHARETKRVQAFHELAVVDGQGVQPDPEDEVEALWDAVRQLPAKTRDAVLLVYAEELTHAKAAEVLECREATVSWHIHEAKKRLKPLLETSGKDMP